MASSVTERLRERAAMGTEIPETGWAYQDGVCKKLADAHVSIATHALNYGTGVFEGIRAYWDAGRSSSRVRLREHFDRMRGNCRLLRIECRATADALRCQSSFCAETSSARTCMSVRSRATPRSRSRWRCMTSERFRHVRFPIGAYLRLGSRRATATWRRTADDAIPLGAS